MATWTGFGDNTELFWAVLSQEREESLMAAMEADDTQTLRLRVVQI
jgi:hypothetical protein